MTGLYKLADVREDDDSRRGGYEFYFDFIDYREIAQHNWAMWEPILGCGSASGKEKRTAWLAFVNEKRRIVAHASSGVSVSLDDLTTIEQFERWLSERVGGQDQGLGADVGSDA